MLGYIPVMAQISLTVSPYFQDFNAGALPIGWSVRTGATNTAPGISATYNAGPTSWTSATGNFRNVASATGLKSTATTNEQNASVNRALGLRQTGTFGDPGAAFVLQLSNTIGWANFVLRFKLQSLDGSAAGRTVGWKVDYGIGSNPVVFSTVPGTPLTPTTALGPAAWGSQDVVIDFADVLDDQSANVWIRIVTLTASAGTGSRPTSAIDDVELSFTPADKTAPTFLAGPVLSNTKPTSTDLATTLDENGTLYYVILAAIDVPPSVGQVRLGQNGLGMVLPAVQQGSVMATAQQNTIHSLVGLRGATEYEMYIVAEDKHHNLQSTLTSIAFRTPDPPDVQAPIIDDGFPRINQLDTDQVLFSISFDEPGAFHFMTLDDNTPPPGVSQLQSEPAVMVTVAHEATVVMSRGLTPGNIYTIYWIAEDHFGNVSALKQFQFKTGNRYIENFDGPESTWSFDRISLAGDQDWAYDDGSALIDGFDGKAVANEDWLVSPVLQTGDRAVLSFYSRYSFSGNPLALRLSTTNAQPGGPGWIDIPFVGRPTSTPINSALSTDWTRSLVDLSAYSGKAIRLAFVYTSSSAGARACRVDSVRMDNVTPVYVKPHEDNIVLNSSKPLLLTWFSVGIMSPISINAPGDFALSLDSMAYKDSLLVLPSPARQRFWIKRKSSAPGEVQGDITFRSGLVTGSVHVASSLMDETFDVSTFNLEFFGTNVRGATGQEFGPADDTLQVRHVARVIRRMGSDLIAVQEVSDRVAWDTLMRLLPQYKSMISNRWSHSMDPPDPNFPPQQIGFIYDTTAVELIAAQPMFKNLYDDIRAGKTNLPGYPGGSSSFWSSGRLPFRATVRVKALNEKRTIQVIDIHAKSGAAQTDHDRRKYDAAVLYDSLTQNFTNQSVVLMGDFNDEISKSITPGAASPYQPFMDDTVHFAVLTRTTVGYSYPATKGFIDHVIVSKDLLPWLLGGSVRTEDARKYVTNYTTTTSDHLPVTARFMFVPRPQYIATPSFPPTTYGDLPFRIEAKASSGLPVSITSQDTSRLIIRHDSVFVRGAGSVTLRYSQSGNQFYAPAEAVEITIVVGQASQQLQVPPITDKTVGNADFSVPATTSSELKVVMKAITNNVLIMPNNLIHLTEAGPATIIFSQPGDSNYKPAASMTRSFCIKPPPPEITAQTNHAPEFVLTSSAPNGNQWYFRGTPIAGATAPILSTHVPGVYTVQATVGNCISVFSHEFVLVINDLEISTLVSVYPNPATKSLQVTGLDEVISVCDMAGRIWSPEFTRHGYEFVIHLDALPPGNYALVGSVKDVLRVARFTRSPY